MLDNLFKKKIYVYILLSLVIFYTVAQLFTITSQDSITKILSATTEKKKYIFEHWLNERLNAVKYLSIYPNPHKLVSINKERLLKSINSSKVNKVYDIFFVNPNGKIVTDNYEKIINFPLEDSGKTIREYDINFEVETKEIRYSNYYKDYVLDIYAPVYENSELKLFAVETISLKPIQDLMMKVSRLKEENTYIVDSHGKILVGYDNNIINKNIKETDIANLLNGTISTYLDYENKSVYGNAINLYKNKWILITQISEENVANTTNNIKGFFIKSWAAILAIWKLLDKHKEGDNNE